MNRIDGTKGVDSFVSDKLRLSETKNEIKICLARCLHLSWFFLTLSCICLVSVSSLSCHCLVANENISLVSHILQKISSIHLIFPKNYLIIVSSFHFFVLCSSRKYLQFWKICLANVLPVSHFYLPNTSH